MMNVDNPNRSADRPEQAMQRLSLTQWILQCVGIKPLRVRSRVRGNILHILLESPSCPAVETALPLLKQAFAETTLDPFLPADTPPIYRVVVYGRALNQATPAWTKAFALQAPPPLPPLPHRL